MSRLRSRSLADRLKAWVKETLEAAAESLNPAPRPVPIPVRVRERQQRPRD